MGFYVIGRIQNLYRYPIKGLSAEPLETVELRKGLGFPMDRAFGFARPDSGFDPSDPKPLPKTKFVMLAKEEKLALLRSQWDEETGTLTISGNGQTISADIATDAGREKAARFLSEALGIPHDLQPTLESAGPHRFTDVSVVSPQMMNAVSLINTDSVARFSEAIGQTVDPARFRGNILFSGFEPFSELDLVGRHISVGDIEMKIVRRTKRCPATEVNLQSGTRDLETPRLLREHFGHSDMGVYAEILSDGILNLGDELRIIA